MEHIRTCREAAGLNQTELAKKLGVAPSAVSVFEMPGRYPDARRLPAIADALDCTIDALYGRRPSDITILPREGGDFHGV